jgi:hypothetical protein
MSKTKAEMMYEAKNTELIRAMGELAAAVDSRDPVAVDQADAKVRKLLGELRAMLRVI